MDWSTLNVVLGVVVTLVSIAGTIYVYRTRPGATRRDARTDLDDE